MSPEGPTYVDPRVLPPSGCNRFGTEVRLVGIVFALPQTRPRRIAFVVALTGAALLASGCATAAGPSAAPTSSATEDHPSSDIAGETVTGKGPTGWPGVQFPIPGEARSVSIELSCDGNGYYSVELGDSMATNLATISGMCGAEEPLSWPVSKETVPSIAVTVDEGVRWTATSRFSTAEFPRDAAVTADCAAFTDVYSALINADQGFNNYDAFDETAWLARVEDASSQLAELAAASTSTLAVPLAEMGATVASASEAGTALLGTDDALTQIGTACNANQTPYFVKAEFGG